MTLEMVADTTRCRTVAMHPSEADRHAHDRAGFHQGWGTVLDQLATYVLSI